MITFILPPLVSFLLVLGCTPLVIRLATKYSLLDNPTTRKHPAHTHTETIPRAGGLAILFGVVGATVFFIPANKALSGILLAACVTTMIGLLDDRIDLSPYLRFITNIMTALVVVAAGVGIPFITNPFGGIIHLDSWRLTFSLLGTHSILVWADLLAIIWIVWTMNIVGWSSGVDGQLPGFSAVTLFILGVSSLRFSAHDISQLSIAKFAFIGSGAFLGFLPWNFYPQKIMPGYGGKTLAGLLIATLAIVSGNKLGSALLILAIPMLDAVYTVVRRLAKKQSPFRGDRKHLHHRLLDLGWGKRKIALFYMSVSAILGTASLTLGPEQKVFAFLVVGTLIGGIIIWTSYVVNTYTTKKG